MKKYYFHLLLLPRNSVVVCKIVLYPLGINMSLRTGKILLSSITLGKTKELSTQNKQTVVVEISAKLPGNGSYSNCMALKYKKVGVTSLCQVSKLITEVLQTNIYIQVGCVALLPHSSKVSGLILSSGYRLCEVLPVLCMSD